MPRRAAILNGASNSKRSLKFILYDCTDQRSINYNEFILINPVDTGMKTRVHKTRIFVSSVHMSPESPDSLLRKF